MASIGEYYFITLLGGPSGVQRQTCECFVVSLTDDFAIIAVAEGFTEDGSWSTSLEPHAPAASGGQQPAAPAAPRTQSVHVDDQDYRLMRVQQSALLDAAPEGPTPSRFTARPASHEFLTAFYRSGRPEAAREMEESAADTSGAGAGDLAAENARLRAELTRQRGSASSGRPPPDSGRGARRAGELPPQRYGAQRSEPRRQATRFAMDQDDGAFLSAGEDPEPEAASEDEEEPLDGLGRLMRDFDMNSLAQGHGGNAGRSGRRAGSGPGMEPPSSHGSSAGAVPHGPGNGLGAGSQGRNLDPAAVAAHMQMQLQYEMVRALQDLRSHSTGTRDDAPSADELDGLRVARNLGRMRMLKEGMEHNPRRNYSEYRDLWIRELGAEGRAFRWIDRNKAIRWGKYASIRRVDWMLCNLMETLDRKEPELCRAQVVQCMKALHEFSNVGSWKTAWPLTHMVDPLRSYTHGGTEVEMETVLSYVRTQDDLKKKVLSGSRRAEDGEAEEEDPEAEGETRRQQQRARAKAKARAAASRAAGDTAGAGAR